MDKKSTPTKAEKNNRYFRIAVCLLAILALSAALAYMFYEIRRDSNVTKRLLAEAFMALTTSESVESESADPPSTSVPTTETTVTPETVAFVAVNLANAEASLVNYTSYGIDQTALSSYTPSFSLSLKEPTVLILHTHPQEAYAPEGVSGIDPAFSFESSNENENIVAVGEAVAEVLNTAGIPTLHILDASENPEDVINKYRTLYPSITFVLDIHRDGIYTTDGRIVKTDTSIANEAAAQLMFAVGTHADNPSDDWQDNLAAAWQLTSLLASSHDSLMRSLLLRPEGLHQQYAPCTLSLYVGTTGNTLSEALVSARYFAKYFAIYLLQQGT